MFPLTRSPSFEIRKDSVMLLVYLKKKESCDAFVSTVFTISFQ